MVGALEPAGPDDELVVEGGGGGEGEGDGDGEGEDDGNGNDDEGEVRSAFDTHPGDILYVSVVFSNLCIHFFSPQDRPASAGAAVCVHFYGGAQGAQQQCMPVLGGMCVFDLCVSWFSGYTV